MSWMDIILSTTVKLSKKKLRPFKHSYSMLKWPVGSVNVGNITNYPIHLPISFPRGLEVDSERSSTFPILMLLMYIDRLGLVSHFY